MKNRIICIAIAVFSSLGGYAQNHVSHHQKKKTHNDAHKEMHANAMPTWASAHHYNARAHAYFPDYYTYYDANRKGYVYWSNGKYVFTPALPPFLEKVDLSKSRIQVLKGLSLDMHPERNYPRYMKMYPAEQGHNMVPVPGSDTR